MTLSIAFGSVSDIIIIVFIINLFYYLIFTNNYYIPAFSMVVTLTLHLLYIYTNLVIHKCSICGKLPCEQSLNRGEENKKILIFFARNETLLAG